VPPGQSFGCDNSTSLPAPLIECSLPSQSWMASDLRVATCLTKPIAAEDLLAAIGQVDGAVGSLLIIDDDRGFCHLVQRILQAGGRTFDVRLAYDGNDGLAAMRHERPDLVLLDLIMPDLDGFQVLEVMQHDPDLVNVPVILLTATSYAEDALAQRSSQIVIRRATGLRPAEALRCVQAVIEVLEPDYASQPSPEEF
jgi:CheY-like chemotaxis protein